MNKKSKRSSRKLMSARNRRRESPAPGFHYAYDKKKGEPVWARNRAKRRLEAAWKQGAEGRQIQHAENEKRKANLLARRKVLREIRKETIRLMRGSNNR